MSFKIPVQIAELKFLVIHIPPEMGKELSSKKGIKKPQFAYCQVRSLLPTDAWSFHKRQAISFLPERNTCYCKPQFKSS